MQVEKHARRDVPANFSSLAERRPTRKSRHIAQPSQFIFVASRNANGYLLAIRAIDDLWGNQT
ncbi:hypothetical protein [Paraburkholderia sp. BR14374]|uniref:hypothetical protein n=1 Tax=Paraburkholderia sp. BR14374 TaxID=3237007 RepID=UPI0034CFF0A3